MPTSKPFNPILSYALTDSVREPAVTLRDLFAAAALTGCLAYSRVNPASGNYHENCTPEGAATDAYIYADAMLRAREEATDAAE